MDINKNPDLVVGDIFMCILLSQKELGFSFLLSCFEG